MKKIYLTGLFSFIFFSAFAQYNRGYRLVADKAFDHKNYYAAAYYYSKAMGEKKSDPQLDMAFDSKFGYVRKTSAADSAWLFYRAGESYRLYENYREAERKYDKALQAGYDKDYPLTRLWYAICLRAGGQYDKAIGELTKFLAAFDGEKEYRGLAEKELADCRFAKEQYQNPAMAEIEKIGGSINAGDGNYALTKQGENFYFTSSRYLIKNKKAVNRLYKLKKNDTAAPGLIGFKDEGDSHFGTPSFDPQGKRMYFTKWDKVDDKLVTGIYYSNFESNRWSAPEKLNENVNTDGYNSRQPFVSSDGKKLFYASDKPGGLGGDDIWVSELDDSGQAVNSTNLGNKINTIYDEQAPYYDIGEKRLVYSSKGFVGLGGFDLFESFGGMTAWSAPRNLGYPINSVKDDLYYLPDNDDVNKFYLSSDRESDCCLNLFVGKITLQIHSGLIVDCDKQKPIAGVKVTYTDSSPDEKTAQVLTDNSGKYSLLVKVGHRGQIKLEKDGYTFKNAELAGSFTSRGDTIFYDGICLEQIKKLSQIGIKNVLFDFNSHTLDAEAGLTLDSLVHILQADPSIKLRLTAHTDSVGSFDYNIRLSQNRMRACTEYIVGKGITQERLSAESYGKTRPAAPNSLPDGHDNPVGRHLNRRVEFAILKPGDEQ